MSDAGAPERRSDPEEVLELFRRLPDPAARDELTRRFLPFAEYLARRFTGRGESQEDLEQVAGLGLVLAVDRFDVERGVAFSTYAAATIIGELKRHFRDKGWAIRVPRLVQEHSLDVGKAAQTLWQELGRSPTVPELARKTGLSEDEVLEAIDASQAYRASSIDAPMGEDGASHADSLGERDEALEHVGGVGDGQRRREAAAAARAQDRVPALLQGADTDGDRGGDRHLADARLPVARADAEPAARGDRGARDVARDRGRRRRPIQGQAPVSGS